MSRLTKTFCLCALILWAYRVASAQYLQIIGGTLPILSHDVAVDGEDNVYVTGGFAGNALFDGAGAVLSSVGLRDIFVAKYNPEGVLQWYFGIGGKLGGPGLDDEGRAISVSSEGDVYVAGYFQGEADFDPGPDTFMLKSAGFRDAFIASYTPGGALRWARRFGGEADDMALGVHAENPSSVYFTGLFRDRAFFEPAENATTVESNGEEDGFVIRLKHDGGLTWILPYGGSSVDAGQDIDVDASGNIYLLGHFSGRVDFDRNSIAGEITSLNGTQDAVLASYTPVGGLRWAFPLGGPQQDGGLGLAVDAAGNSFITGHFVGRMDFDPDEFNEFTLTSVGARDLYVARYNTVGALVWAKQAGSGFAEGDDVAVTASGRVLATGFFSGSIFPDPQSSFTLTARDEQDIVLVSYDASGAFLWAGGIGGSFAEFGSGVATNSRDQVYLTGYFETEVDFDPGVGELIRTSAGSLDAFLVRYETDGALAVSVEETADLGDYFMELYPNPVQSRVHVVMSFPGEEIEQLEMVDVLGRRMRFIDRIGGLIGSEATVSLDLTDIPPGVYFVRARNTYNRATSRSFVVVH